jgi:hypothetical protein
MASTSAAAKTPLSTDARRSRSAVGRIGVFVCVLNLAMGTVQPTVGFLAGVVLAVVVVVVLGVFLLRFSAAFLCVGGLETSALGEIRRPHSRLGKRGRHWPYLVGVALGPG